MIVLLLEEGLEDRAAWATALSTWVSQYVESIISSGWGWGDRVLSYLILLQERSSPQDPSTLALRIWNNMVSVEM